MSYHVQLEYVKGAPMTQTTREVRRIGGADLRSLSQQTKKKEEFTKWQISYRKP
jgi:hypothetical protein